MHDLTGGVSLLLPVSGSNAAIIHNVKLSFLHT
jgi:hypothetical protein